MFGLLAGLFSLAPTFAAIPTGKLNVDRTMVRVGTKSQLNWTIDYPSDLTEVVDVTNDVITVKKSTKMKVRVLGVAFQSGSTLLPVNGYYSVNGGSWASVFYGTSLAVNSATVLLDKSLNKNDKVSFGGRGWDGSGWLPFHQTGTNDKYVTVLQNGSVAPSYVPAYNQGTVTSFLKPYIDGKGKISIGSKDLIVLWECSTAAPGTTYFDMQDLVMLVTFE